MTKKYINIWLIIIMLLLSCTSSFSEPKGYIFNPTLQNYELYNGILYLWGTDTTGFKCLFARTQDAIDQRTINAWLAILIAAQAMGKTVAIQYESTNGKIYSLYGPK